MACHSYCSVTRSSQPLLTLFPRVMKTSYEVIKGPNAWRKSMKYDSFISGQYELGEMNRSPTVLSQLVESSKGYLLKETCISPFFLCAAVSALSSLIRLCLNWYLVLDLTLSAHRPARVSHGTQGDLALSCREMCGLVLESPLPFTTSFKKGTWKLGILE